MKTIRGILTLGFIFLSVTASASVSTKVSVGAKVAVKPLLQSVSESAFKTFQSEALADQSTPIDYMFLKVEKKQNFKSLTASDLELLTFNYLTNKVIVFVNKLNTAYNLPLNSKLRKQMQLEFYGLSQAIKKANELSLTVQVDHFDKLHDMLMGQGATLFYASYKDKYKADLFFTAYFLNELEYPMDLTAKHLQALQKKSKAGKFDGYISKLARTSLIGGHQLNKLTSNQVETLYNAALVVNLENSEMQQMQKSYLKQLQLIGDQEKIKTVKRQLASTILWQETKNLFSSPLNFFKYIQFLVGYIFIAWPLEMILMLIAVVIFGWQSSSVLTHEEKKKNSMWKKLWLMFTKAYMGSNVPFFSKLAASLVLFGVGLYFNSAKNFVESMIANM